MLLVVCAASVHAQTSPEVLRQATGHDQAGRQFLAKHDWKAAIAEFDRALQLDGSRADSLIGLGIARWGGGNHEGAIQAFQRAAAIDPKSADAHFNIGVAWKELGETAKSSDELNTALRLHPGHEPARLELAMLQQESGQLDQAIAEYQLILKSNPSSADAHNWLGVAYLQKNSLEPAIAEFRRAIRLKADYVRAHNNLGSTLAQAGDVEAGIAALREGLKYGPEDLQLRINLGMALRSKGDADAALTQFQSLLQEHPESAELLHQFAQTLRQKGDLEGAIQAFERVLALNPEARETYYGLGQALKEAAAANRAHPKSQRPTPANGVAELMKAAAQAMASRDLAQVRRSLEKAIEVDPSYAEAYNLLGFTLGKAGDLTAAIDKLKQAVALDPEIPDAHYNLGVALWFHQEREAAAKELDQSLRLNPAAGAVYSFRGMVYRESGDLDGARRAIYRAIALSPENAVPYIDLGVVFLRQGQLASAIGQFEAGLNLPSSPIPVSDLQSAAGELRRAIPRAEGPAEAYHVLGRMLGVAGAPALQVVTAFQDAIRLRPDYAQAHNSLGLVLVQTGDDEKAIEAFREAIRLRPDFADAHQNLGAVLTASDPAEAVRELERAAVLDPRLLKAQYNLALAYEASPGHGPVRAIDRLRKLLAAENKYPRAEFVLGRVLLRQGDVTSAIKHLQTAVAQEPEFGEARYQLGLALSRAGRKEEGAAEVKKGRELIAASEGRQAAALDISEAQTALDQGDFDQAIAKAQKVIAFRTDAAEPYYVLGAALASKRQSADAAAAFRRALAIDPGHSRAAAALKTIAVATPIDDPVEVERFEGLIRGGRFQEVESPLCAYLENRPKSSWGWYALGYSYYGQRKIGDSIQALARSLQLDVRNADAHKVLGRDLMIIGRFDAAKLEFEQGARLDPTSAEMPYNLGKLYSIQDNWADARKSFEAAVRLNPRYMEAHDGLGFALEALHDDTGAIACYQKAIELNEASHAGFASPYVNLSALYNRNGDREATMKYARKALEVNERSDRALFQLAKACERDEDLTCAAESLNRAIAINPRASSYFYVLATVLRKLGKVDESRQAMAAFSKLERETNELDQRRRDWAREEEHPAPATRPETVVHE
jgi:tetratricopeptide (TPR) repeat protein